MNRDDQELLADVVALGGQMPGLGEEQGAGCGLRCAIGIRFVLVTTRRLQFVPLGGDDTRVTQHR